MKLGIGRCLGLVALTLAACSPQPAPRPPLGDSGPVPSSDAICAHLAAVCGVDAASCARKLEQVHTDRLTLYPEACWLAGATPAAINACGGITCVPMPDAGP